MSLRPLFVSLALAFAPLASFAQSLTVTGTTTLPADTVASYSTITVQNGGTLDIGGGSTITVTGALAINAGGTVICRGKNTTAQVNSVWAGAGVTINAGSVTIAATGKLSADGQGYANAAGPGYNVTNANNYHMGASYGGRGVAASGQSIAPVYGLQLQPADLGSAGGIWTTGEQSAGGGAVRLVISGTLTLDGEISADGTGSGTYEAGGTGGSIWVTTQALTGAGKFTADASAPSNSQGACSGGRIAVYYTNASGYSGFASASALGAAGSAAENGTVVFVDTTVADGGHLRVFQRADFAEDSTPLFGAVTVEANGQIRVGGGSTVTVTGALNVAGTGTLLCQGRNATARINGAWAGAGVTINAASVSIEAAGAISADGQGYRNGTGPGYHFTSANNYHMGASYGGLGVAATGQSIAPTYGSPLQPIDLGSAGGQWSGGEESAGGGAIRLNISGTFTLNGEITADGVGSGTFRAAGTGGSIWVTTQTLAGSGKFTADAGIPTNSQGACSGGRIAVYYASASGFSGFTSSSANGASGSNAGDGTLGFFDTSVTNLHLRVFQRWRVEPDATARFGRVTLDDAARFELGGGGTLNVDGALVVQGASQLRVEAKNISAPVDGAWAGTGAFIHAATVTVASDSAITADGQGYRNGTGPGFNLTSANNYHMGASHGGLGATTTGQSVAPVYGSALQPMVPGASGGVWTGGEKSAGGGAIHLLVDGTLTVDGEITADGVASGTYQGGAAGGSVWVETQLLRGAGKLTADAFAANNSQGQSAGGRVAVYYRDGTGFGGFNTSSVNAGGATAQPGTLLFMDTSVAGFAVRVTQRMSIAENANATFGSLTIDDSAMFELGGGATLDVTGTLEIKGNSTLVVHARDRAAQVNDTWIGSGGLIDAGNLVVAAGSRITADGEGYQNGAGPGFIFTSAYNYHMGSSHGGRGQPANGQTLPPPYGSPLEPVALGSSGAVWSGGEKSAGGGTIRIIVDDTLTLGGDITANGVASGTYHGGACGGSIWVTTHTLTGAGKFTADAFPSSNSQGNSAGGRIAVYYADATGFTGFTSSTAKHLGSIPAEDGTVVFIDTGSGRLDAHVFTRLATEDGGSLTLDSLALEDGAVFDLRGGSFLQVTDLLDVKSGVTINLQSINRTGKVRSSWAGAGGTIDAGQMTVAATAVLNGNGQGYLNAGGPGGVTPTSDYNVGASYGGRGSGAKTAPVYGSERAPRDLGSAGGLWSSGETTAGGGAVFINVVDALTLDGRITVDGVATGTYHAGATGGSVMVNAGSLVGAGSISANAAQPKNSTSGSGGGRIAVHTANSNGFTPAQFTATGSGPNGSAGSVYLGTSPSVDLALPNDMLLHGSVELRWSGLAVNLRTTTFDVVVSGGGQSTTLVSGAQTGLASSWDTTSTADGLYEVRVIARNTAGVSIAESAHVVAIVNNAVWHTGAITASETWAANRVHIVEGAVTIASPGAVTIEAGAVVKFLPGASLTVDTGATLNIPSDNASKTILTDVADDSAGGDTNRDGTTSVPVAGRWNGLVVTGGTLSLSDQAEIRYIINSHAGTLASSQTWLGSQVHHVTDDVVVPAGSTLTILPGAIVKFADKKGIVINDGATLDAQGVLAQPIVFTSDKDDSTGGDTNKDGNATSPAAGDWHWLFLAGTAHIRHAHLLYAAGTQSGAWSGDGAVRTTGNANVTLESVTIKDAFFDGILPWGGPISITNCVVTRADRGIMAHPGSTATVLNTTVDNCRQGILCHGGTLTVRNSIVAHCLESGIQYDFGTITAITYCDIWNTAPTAQNYRATTDLTGTAGNISLDPKFRDAARDNFHPGYGSPAIDSADGAVAPATDFTGVARYDDPHVTNTGANGVADMGAFEFADTAGSQLDLAVATIDGPAIITAGSTVTVNWTVRNVGPVAISGPWRDRISLQPAADINAALLLAGDATVGAALHLGPGESASFSKKVVVPPAIEGRYRWIIDTNVERDIFEGRNTANNRLRAVSATRLNVPALSPGTSVAGVFATAGVPELFKIVPAAGADVLLTLDRTGTAGWSRLAVAAERLPTLSDHDAISTEWNQPDATVAISATTGGTYYVAAYPVQLPSSPLTFSLGVQAVGFSATHVDISSGTNRGTVTIPVVGTGLRPDATVTLSKAGSPTLTASSVYPGGTTRLHATFDLTAAATGAYDVNVEQVGITRTLSGVFTVATGAPGELRTAVLMPATVRAGRQFTAWIDYQNVGGTDLVLPVIGVRSPDGIPLTLTAGDAGTSNLSILAISPSGTPWILAPGQSGRIGVLYTAHAGSNRISTTITTTSSIAPMNWSDVRTELRPATNLPPGWDAAWDATVASYGQTSGDYAHWMLDAYKLWHARTGQDSSDPALALNYYLYDRIAAAAARVEGHVRLKDENGTPHPLGGAIVALLDSSGAVADTTASARDGFLRFSQATAGTYTVAIDENPSPSTLDPVTVPDSGPPVSVNWMLDDGGEIRGTTSLDGTIDRSLVTIGALHLASRRAYVAAIDELGRYSFHGLPAGTFTLYLAGDGIVPVTVEGVVVPAAGIVTGPEFPVVRPARIRGTVKDAATNQPVANAAIAAFGDGLAPGGAVSATDGSFTLNGLARGTYTVVAAAKGFARASQNKVVVDSGGAPAVDLLLPPGATLSGHVSSAGTPVKDALIVITGGRVVLGTATSLDDGSYAISGLPAGTFDVAIESAAHQPEQKTATLTAGSTSTLDVALTLAPSIQGVVRAATSGDGLGGIVLQLTRPDGSTTEVFTDKDGGILFGRLTEGTYTVSLQDGSQRKTFTVSAGGVVSGTLDFAITAGSIAGRVFAADGTTPVDATVMLLAGDQVVATQGTTKDGEYLFNLVAPGAYSIKYVGNDRLFAPQSPVIVRDRARTTVAAAVAGARSLTVTVPGSGTPATDAVVILEPVDRDAADRGLRIAKVDSSGRALFDGLAAGDYRAQAASATGVSDISIVSISTSNATAMLNIVAGGSIRGVVRNGFGQFVGGAVATAYRPASPGVRWTARTSATGDFSLPLLPAGTYTLVVSARPAASLDTPLAPEITSNISITADATVVHNATLTDSATGVAGHVLTMDGSAPLDATVELRDTSGLVIASSVAGSDGSFALPRVAAGDYTLAARAGHFSVPTQALTLAAGASRPDSDLTATWVGGFGIRELLGAAALRMRDDPRVRALWLADIGSDYAQRFENAMNKLLRDLLGAPPDAVNDLRRPNAFDSLKCPCPEAEAAWRKALFLQQMSHDRWTNWNEYWQARYEEISADLGLAGVNLLKFASNFLGTLAKAPEGLQSLMDGRREVLMKIADAKRRGLNLLDPDLIPNLEHALEGLTSSFHSVEWLLTNSGGLVGSGVSSFLDSGVYGNATGILEVFSDPGTYFTKNHWDQTIEQVNSFVSNVQGIAGTLNTLASSLQSLSNVTGPFGDALGKLGAFTDGLQTLIESWRGVSAYLGTTNDLKAREWEYLKTIEARDQKYREALALIAACAQKKCDDDPEKKKPKPPSPHGGKPGGDGGSGGVGSFDPNEKLTSGIGAAGYVTPGSPIFYDIHFENVSTASAPAQLVTVTDPLPDSLDWSTFELVEIGFNGVTVAPPAGSQDFAGRATVASDPNPVDVSFSLDPQTGVASWAMRSVDAISGDYPEDPFAGFLPPNDALGHGEGHVSFLIKPKSGLADGATFTNQARIVFDANAPIDTNVTTNTIDSTPATATITPLAAQSASRFLVSWSGNDGGAGVGHYELWVSTDGGAFALYDGAIIGTSALFHGNVGHGYAFYIRAVDQLGQSITLAPSSQTETQAVTTGVSRLANISTRGPNGSGDNAMIVGFVINAGATASTPKNLLLRGVGPRLGETPFNIGGVLLDPRLDLYNSAGAVALSNDDWGTAGNASLMPVEFSRLGAFSLTTGSKDAALLAPIDPGIYTARISGPGTTTGVTLVEAYDADSSLTDTTSPQLLNLSTRGFIGSGDSVLIAGFVVTGDAPKSLLIRAVGPTLGGAPFNLGGVIDDPLIRLTDNTGATVFENDDWGVSPDPLLISEVSARVGAFGLPVNSKDAVMVVTLAPGPYTVVVSGKNNSTGLALVELYDADP